MTDHSIGFGRSDVWTMDVQADVGPPIGQVLGSFAVIARTEKEAIKGANVHMAWLLRQLGAPPDMRVTQS